MATETAPSGYSSADVTRVVDEEGKRSGRSAFGRDRARVLHAASLRRLAATTQVVGPGSHDFVRNRLTHSLEVGQIARELGQAIGCHPDLVETAALAHDLGHPPFGHNGERALDELADSCGGFEGNAQTLRILTRLEAKTAAADGRSVGLNLTRAALDATIKYPWPRAGAGGKFGVYADDTGAFAWIRDGVAGTRRCVEAQVMDLADDVAYCVHDVEDGVVAGRIHLRLLADPTERLAVFDVVRDWYQPDSDDAALDAALERLRALRIWPVTDFDGTRASLASLKRLTSGLIGRFCELTQAATHDRFGGGPLVRHAADLVVPEPVRDEIAVLKGVAAHYVMRAHDRQPAMETQRALLTELTAGLLRQAPGSLSPVFHGDWAAARDDAQRLRVVVDQVASLTDVSAGAWHERWA
jgi:dGTPase